MASTLHWFLVILLASCSAFSKPQYGKVAAVLYPESQEDQNFTAKFFEIVEAHKTADPLLEGPGPSINEYSLDKIKFAFITNMTDKTVDLVFFHWNLSTFQGLEINPHLSALYKSPVYVMKNVNRKSIASQGTNRSQITNFSYMLGSNTMEKQILIDAPAGYQVPDQILNWKPNPEYMDRYSPLRKALGINTLVILSPKKQVFFDGFGIQESARPFMETYLQQRGGFENVVMGTMVHEMFHVKEGEDKVNGFSKGRKLYENRKEIVKQLQSDARLRALFATYVGIIFSIGENMKNLNVHSSELQQLADLKTLITEMKTQYPESWKFIWNYEYTEGFAEYASAYSMIQVGITSWAQKIDLEKQDPANNFAYRTGALGGLYLAGRLQQMPFSHNEDHRESLWETILRLTESQSSRASVDSLVAQYKDAPGVNSEDEVKRVIDYLISTVMDVK